LIVLIVAFESFRGSGQLTMVGTDGKRRPVEQAPRRHILRASGGIVVQSCRGACDQVRL